MKVLKRNHRIKAFLTLAFLFFLQITFAQQNPPKFRWAVNPESIGENSVIEPSAHVTDAAGNSYIAGYFNGSINFGNINLNTNSLCAFVAKIDHKGEWQWALKPESSNGSRGQCIGLDAKGNIYIKGSFNGIAKFGNTTINADFGKILYIAKISNDGQWQWAENWVGNYSNNTKQTFTTDAEGNTYATGYFRNKVTIGNQTLTSTSSDYPDVFVVKLNNNGQWQWAISAGGDAQTVGTGITSGSDGNLYLSGVFWKSVRFGSTNLTTNSGASGELFITKISSDGQWQWAIKPVGMVRVLGSTVDATGNIFVTGIIEGFVSFDNISISSSGSYDIYVAKLNPNGEWQWVSKAGGSDYDWGEGIVTDKLGNIFITGKFTGNASFPGTTLRSTGVGDMYIAKLNASGQWQWAINSGSSDKGSYEDGGVTIGLDANNYIYVNGYFKENIILGNINLSSNKNYNAFITQLSDQNTGVNEFKSDLSQFKIFPNPASTILTIESDYQIKSPVVITDLTGRIVLVQSNNIDSRYDLVISTLSKGMYLINIDNHSFKFIKE